MIGADSFEKAELVYSGAYSKCQFQPFIKAVKGKAPTFCVVKCKGLDPWAMYTDIAWDDDEKLKKGEGNSFVGTIKSKLVDPNEPYGRTKISIMKHTIKEGEPEVFHSKNAVFAMAGGPYAAKLGGKNKSYAFLGE